ncbi:unnamed protein product [Prorocentrum cordatum]|uniref:Uncharacterized protein n=1 Tax=Prorocentrum cordatum TaxID=2364126 RepID=A0ABN9VQL0_9DINO|nr:unnamed protein product [Polarella glacialis]
MALCSGEWVSEAVLWTADWRHMGELMCCYVCPILTVEPETFFKVVHSHPRSWFLAKTYARMFVNWINDEDPKHRMDTSKVTDVIRSGRAWLDSEALWYKETGEFLEAQLEEMVEKARKASEEAAVQHLEHCVSDDGSQDVPNGCGGSRPGKHVDAGDHQLARPGSEEAPKGRRGAEGARRVEPSPARGAEGPGRCRPACEALAGASPAQRGPRRVLAGLCGGH